MEIVKLENNQLENHEIFAKTKYTKINYPIHWHEYYEIILYKNCKGTCEFNGKRFEITDNCIFFLTPADYHKIEGEPNENQYTVNISFTETVIDNLLLKANEISPCVVYNPDPFLSDSILKIRDIFNQKDKKDTDGVQKMHILNSILIMLKNSGIPVDSKTTAINPYIRSAISIVRENISQDNSLTEISKKCGLSPSYFSYLFHKEYGITYKDWLLEIKIAHSKRLLENTDLSILDIALECGYESPSNFAQFFKRIIGMSPSQYRKKHNPKGY